jgi:hypothetical protein
MTAPSLASNTSPLGVDTIAGEVLTPLGLMSSSGLAALCAFGDEAERLEYPSIDVGGFIVPGREPAASHSPGKEPDNNVASTGEAGRGQPPRAEAGAAAGTRQRPPSSQAAAPGASPHALEPRLKHLYLDLPGLVDYHPLARVSASTEEVVYFNIPIGVFASLPIRARLTLEVPLLPRDLLLARHPLPVVPNVRAWATWEGGPTHGALVTSHHRYPDLAICACMTGQWIRGVHPLHDYVAFCIVWVGKALHDYLVGFYPGRQHYGALDRVRRDRTAEFCGCGSTRRYRDCCRAADQERTPFDRWRETTAARRQYLQMLKWQGRAFGPPDKLLRSGISLR